VPPLTAHVLASLTFGVGFVLLTVGRSELFTENFLIPVAAVLSGHATRRSVARLWGITFALNLVGIALFVVMLSTPGVLERESLEAAGGLADTLTERDLLAAAVSAVLGGVVITVFTWLAEAAESDLTRLFIALAVGFVLLAPSLNHSVVGFGEILFGIAAGTTDADWVDLLRIAALRDDVIIRPLMDAPVRHVTLAWPAGAYRSKSVLAMCDILRGLSRDHRFQA